MTFSLASDYNNRITEYSPLFQGSCGERAQIVGGNSGVYRFFFFQNGYKYVDSKTKAELNKWMHVGVTYDSKKGKVQFYINGKADAEHDFPHALPVSKSPLYIAMQHHSTLGPTQYWDGFIDDLALFDVALTEKEIQEAMVELSGYLSVEQTGKITVTWGRLKADY